MESLSLTSSQLAGAYMLGTFLAAFPLAFVGPLSDRFGIRAMTLLVACGLCAACLLASYANGFWWLLACFWLLRFLGQGSMTLLSGNLVSMWFRNRLGSVNAAMSVGGAAAFGSLPLLLLILIESIGWRTSFALMGCAVAAAVIPATLLFIRNRPEDLGLAPDGIGPVDPPASSQDDLTNNHDETHHSVHPVDDWEPSLTLHEAIRHRAFWILALGIGSWALIGTGIVFYSQPLFAQFGIQPNRSQLLFTTFSACMLASQIIGGVLADRLPINRLLAVGFLLLCLGVLVIPFTQSEWHVHAFAAFFGAGQGVALATNSTLWVRYYGRDNLGAIRGAVWCLTVAGSGCGPFILGIINDWSGSFTPGLWLFAALLAPLTLLMLAATEPPVPERQRVASGPASVGPTNPATAESSIQPHGNERADELVPATK